jgi:hypothetical protein
VVGASTARPGGTARPETVVTVPRPVGVQFHGMWADYTDHTRAIVLDKLRAAGVTTVRMDVSWAMLQPLNGSSYDPWGVGFVDRVIKMAAARGIRPLVTLWLTPGWANGGSGERVLPSNPADYARVARWAAHRWAGKVLGWEVWNEPNSPDFLVGADPVAYTRLLRAAYPAFHAGYRATTVVYGGVQYNDAAWIQRSYDAGAKGYFDVLATHPYQGLAHLAPSAPDDGTMWTLRHVTAVRNLMVARGDAAKPIWFTELGWSSHSNPAGTPSWQLGVDEATQAAYLTATAQLIARSMPYVTRLYWYDERDDHAADLQNQHYGLLHDNLRPKPALAALARVNRAARAGAGI